MLPVTLQGEPAANRLEIVRILCVYSVWFEVTCLLSACSAPMDTNLLSNIHKLFSERIDIFSSVEFNKVSAGLNYAAVYP